MNDVLALDDGKLLPWAMFITIQGYLERCKPTLERLYRLCAAMREENPRYARMYEKIDRFFKNGGSELADDSFSYAHYLKAHHADPQAYQDALRAMEQEMVAHLGALKQSAGMGHPTTKQGSTPSARPPCAPELPSTQQPKQLAGDANFTRGPAPLQASASPPPPATPPFNSTPNTGALSKAMALLESAPPGVLQRAMRLARECP